MRHLTWSLALAFSLLLPSAVAAQSASLNFSAADRGQQEEFFEAATPQMRMSSYLSSMKNAAPVPIEDEQPIGYFARRLVTGCNTCHVAFPKLNTYGRLVKNMGYQLPELDLSQLHEPALKKVTRYIPLSFRGVLDLANGDPNDLNAQLDVRALQMLSGGTAWGNRLSWWAHTHIVEENEFVNPFTNTPHELWAQYNLSFGAEQNRLSFRGGMSELPLWFAPSKTKLSEIPYAIYDAAVGESVFTLSTPQYGFLVQGARLDDLGNDLDFSYAVAAVTGEQSFDSQRFTHVFSRFTKTMSGVNFGLFGYTGSQDFQVHQDEHAEEEQAEEEHAEETHDEHGAEEPTSLSVHDRLYRVGFDIDADIGRLNVFGLGLYGRNSNPGPDQSLGSRSYYGGFVGADFSVTERLILSTRFDAVRFRDNEQPHDEHAEPEHQEEAAPAHDDDLEAGHLHGEIVRSNTDALVFGLNYLLAWQVRLTTEYRKAFNGLEDKLIVGLQFAF